MLFEKLQIRDVLVQPAHILAPMAGITDTVFRRFIKRLGGCGLIMTEFVSSEGMLRQNLRSKRYLYYTEEERPISGQLFGANPDRLAEAARMIEGLGFDLVDLNLGRPAKEGGQVRGFRLASRSSVARQDPAKDPRRGTNPFYDKVPLRLE